MRTGRSRANWRASACPPSGAASPRTTRRWPERGEHSRAQIEAIVGQRQLLDATDPVPALSAELTGALRTALTQAEQAYEETYGTERQRLEGSESWLRIDDRERRNILAELRLGEKASTGQTGTEAEILASLDHISLEAWRTRTAALPQLFAEARVAADRLLEPTIRHVKLTSSTLRTPADVKSWIESTERKLQSQVLEGPVVVG